jgi:hypothetical protein
MIYRNIFTLSICRERHVNVCRSDFFKKTIKGYGSRIKIDCRANLRLF